MVFISSFLGCPKWGNFLCVVLVFVVNGACMQNPSFPRMWESTASQWIAAVAGMTKMKDDLGPRDDRSMPAGQ